MTRKWAMAIAAIMIPQTAGCHSAGNSRAVLVEAESFREKGGWKVDQQFTHEMGSSYLLAHGMGTPVANAKTA